MEDLVPFFVEYKYRNETQLAEVKPCCEEENIFYYDVSIDNQYQFTITPASNSSDSYAWRLALKNADKKVDEALIQTIGEQIDRFNMT